MQRQKIRECENKKERNMTMQTNRHTSRCTEIGLCLCAEYLSHSGLVSMDYVSKFMNLEIAFQIKLLITIIKKSQDYVKVGGFYRPSRTRPISTQGI